MKKLVAKIGLTVILAILISGCHGSGDAQLPEPHDYTHSTELKKVEIYQFAHIEDAERSVFFTLEQLGCDDIILEGGDELIHKNIKQPPAKKARAY